MVRFKGALVRTYLVWHHGEVTLQWTIIVSNGTVMELLSWPGSSVIALPWEPMTFHGGPWAFTNFDRLS